MYQLKVASMLIMMIVSFVISGCTAPQKTVVAPEVTGKKRVIQTLAILPFENNAVTDHESFEPLSKGLSAMLITDLNQCGTVLKIIERNKIQAILKEIILGQTGIVDKATAISAGKILGAQSIAFGSFIVLGNTVRIDTRIVNVETSELIMAESITGSSSAFMKLERNLAEKIAKSLNVVFMPEKVASGSDINAALYFSRGLDLLDKGDRSKAIQLFNKCIELDPAYRLHVKNILGKTS